jgi:hypothetical protein
MAATKGTGAKKAQLLSDVTQPGDFLYSGLVRASRRLARYKPMVEVATRPTPPEHNIKNHRIPEGCQKHMVRHGAHLWHPSGMRFSHKPISGGVARQASLNHRLSSGKPPACSGGLGETALPETGLRVTSVTNEGAGSFVAVGLIDLLTDVTWHIDFVEPDLVSGRELPM